MDLTDLIELDMLRKRNTPCQVKHIWAKERLNSGRICDVVIGVRCPACDNNLEYVLKFCPYCGQAVKDD